MEANGDLLSLLTGYRVSAVLSVAAELAIPDALADGPLTVAELAARVGADEDTLGRLMRALAAIGLCTADGTGAYAGTPLAEALRSQVPGSLRPLARMMQDPAVWAAWGHLAHSVRTGENAFQALHGEDVWAHRATRPEANAVFNANMAALTSQIADAVAAAYDFTGLTTVVDVGGGHGALLQAILAHHEHLSGTVFDLPQGLPSTPPSASDSVRHRWSTASGSFFDAVPAADAYLLKKVLHDWSDERCIEILRTCARSLHPGGVILVIEIVVDRPGRELAAALSDLNMLVLPGGRERTGAEFAALFDAAGLRLGAVIDTGTEVAIIEARAPAS